MKKRLFSLLVIAASFVAATAQQVLSADDCRRMACDNNKALRMASAEQQAAYWQRKSAFTNYLPKISATGGYMFTSKPISLLNDGQKASLPHMGDAAAKAVEQLGAALQLPLGQMLQQPLNAVGQGLVDALNTDTRNAGAIAVMLTQPIYMGGKIRAYNNIARLAEQAAADKYDIELQDVMVQVDETYWQIVALTAKKDLAESYVSLLTKLDSDVQAMIAEGVATKADGLSVKVKLNQANVALIQVNNGLSLLKMLMCQLTGLDITTPITLADENNLDNLTADIADVAPLSADWRTDRPELRALGVAAAVDRERIKLAWAENLPTVALTGGYMMTNPSLFNGFEKKFTGLWNVGVVVNIPIVTWGDRIYKVRQAKAKSLVSSYQLEEATEKIELQISQCRSTLNESRTRLKATESAVAVADENLRMATLGMSEGVIPVSNVNEAQTAWLSARSELIASKIDLKLAHIHLLRALGQLKVEN